MSDVPAWTGLVFLSLVFITLCWVCYGLALPIQITCSLAALFIWKYVLRVPELRAHDNSKEEGDEELVVDDCLEESEPMVMEGSEGPAASLSLERGRGLKDVAANQPEQEKLGASAAAAAAAASAETVMEDEAVDCGAPAVSSSSAPNAVGGSEAASAAAAAAAATASASSSSAAPRVPMSSEDDERCPVDSKEDEESCSDASEMSESDSVRRRREEDMVANPERAGELRLEGNEHFKAGKLHDAREAYSEAIYLTPSTQPKEKAILHANRAACLQKLGRWEEVVEDCKAAIDLDSEYLKAYCRRSIAYEELKRYHDAFEDLKKAVELDPSLKAKEHRRLSMLERKSQEQFEKDKEEMIGKLKELGNTVLGKFGMSCDNFKFEQDPNTGGYSVKFQQ